MILKEAIQIMTDEIVTILADNKPTVYLFGSVALEDFKLGYNRPKLRSIFVRLYWYAILITHILGCFRAECFRRIRLTG